MNEPKLELEKSATAKPESGRKFGCLTVSLLVLAAVIVTAAVTFWIVRAYVFPSEFIPTTLNAREEQVLATKLERLDPMPTRQRDRDGVTPERYSEAGADRVISLSERELNALLAKNTDLARKLAIDLSDNLVSANLLVPVDPDFPIFGGQILKVKAGLELAFRSGRPIVVLKGVSVMGVPIPNAWLGGIKNIDLVSEFGEGEGFWKAFADGVEHLSVAEGRLKIELKE